MKRMPRISLVLALLLAMSLAACGAKGTGGYGGPPASDVQRLPQDLTAYAATAGGSKTLVGSGEQLAAAARQKEALNRPWRLDKPTRWVKQSLGRNFNMKPDKAYTDNKQPFPASAWKAIEANSNKAAYGKKAGPGITLRHTNLRAMPTSMHYYLRPDRPGEGYPFDYFQHSSVPPGTPVYICNVSKDGLWVLAESAATAGWLPAGDVAGVDEAFMQRWQSGPLAAVVREGTDIGETRGNIGTLLPLAGSGMVYYPRRGPSGHAEMAEAPLPPGAVVPVPMPLTADNVALVGNRMMGQKYTWGGLDNGRDCSALTRDLFAPFGLYLPRNSGRQAGVGRPLSLAGMSAAEKEAAIARQAVPFRSLIWLKGHIGVYLGVYEGKPVMYHNIWGVRTKDASGGCDNRAVIGKAVVTTLRPGAERPDLCPASLLIERIEKAVVLPE